jgi:hypothetical protein
MEYLKNTMGVLVSKTIIFNNYTFKNYTIVQKKKYAFSLKS